MHSYKKVFIILVFLLFSGISNSFAAKGVFLDKAHERHGLSASEQRQINMEFLKRFGSPTPATPVRSNNPWEAKKQRTQTHSSASWGECRDYALQKRNACYKQGHDAYNCERFYEARSNKCNQDY